VDALFLAFARHFVICIDDAEVSGGEWDEVLRNTRLNKRSIVVILIFCLFPPLPHHRHLSFEFLFQQVIFVATSRPRRLHVPLHSCSCWHPWHHIENVAFH
jgi:hypothetical protein